MDQEIQTLEEYMLEIQDYQAYNFDIWYTHI